MNLFAILLKKESPAPTWLRVSGTFQFGGCALSFHRCLTPAAIIINGGGKHIRHDHSTTNMIAI